MGFRNFLDPGWTSREQALGDSIRGWVAQGGDSKPARMVCAPLRQDEFVLMAPFLPKAKVLESMRELGRFGWIVVYDEQHMAAAKFLQKQLPIAAILGPPSVSDDHEECSSLGRFHSGYQLQLRPLYGSADLGVALVHRTTSCTTLVLSHSIEPVGAAELRVPRRVRRLADYRRSDLSEHLADLGRGRSKLRVVFHGAQVWDLEPDAWAEICTQSLAVDDVVRD